MLIGSVRENVTVDGHVYPKMDGITASGCTVHFGDWNDYYYCELVANSLASYTHDHQMSILTQVESINVANMTVTSLDGETTDIPTSGRVNYVVVKAKDDSGKFIHGDGSDYATCYHFVDGVQHKHDVADSDNNFPKSIPLQSPSLFYPVHVHLESTFALHWMRFHQESVDHVSIWSLLHAEPLQ
jgi:hypothetical protein